MFRERSDELRLLVATVDFLLSAAAVYTAFALRFLTFDPDLTAFQKIDLNRYILFGWVLAVTQIMVLTLLGFYRQQRFLAFVDEVGALIGGVLLNIAFSFATLYYLRIFD